MRGSGSIAAAVAFGVTALALMAGAMVNARLVHRLSATLILCAGLAIVLLGGLSLLILALAWPSIPGVLGPMMVFVFGMGLVIPNATAAAMEPLPRLAGVASSLLGSAQMAAGSIAGYLVNRFYDGTPIAMASGIAGGAMAAMLAYFLLVHPARRASA